MFEVFTSRINLISAIVFDPDVKRVKEGVGRAVVKEVRENFQSLPPNRDFPSTGFWQRAADATAYEITTDGVRVVVDQIGVRQRLLGGPITPVHGKFLTIPAIAAAYGHRAADFDNLKIAHVDFHPFGPWYRGYSGLALVRADADDRKPSRIVPVSIYFWLVTSVNQEPNPDVLPWIGDMAWAALNATVEALK